MVKINPQIKQLSPNECLLDDAKSWMLDLRKGSNTRKMVSGFIKILNEQPDPIIKSFYQRNKEYVKEIE